MLQCTVHPAGSLSPLKYVVVCTVLDGRWLLSRHRARATWETQGGHIEPGETPIEAARRELYEESGVTGAQLHYVCDYHGYTEASFAEGAVFLAVDGAQGPLPDSEMAETARFSPLPENLTYPLVTPRLMAEAARYAQAHGIPGVPAQ